MPDKVPGHWDATVDDAELERRVQRLVMLRISELSLAERERIAGSRAAPMAVTRPLGDGWADLWLELGNGGERIDLGEFNQAALLSEQTPMAN